MMHSVRLNDSYKDEMVTTIFTLHYLNTNCYKVLTSHTVDSRINFTNTNSHMYIYSILLYFICVSDVFLVVLSIPEICKRIVNCARLCYGVCRKGWVPLTSFFMFGIFFFFLTYWIKLYIQVYSTNFAGVCIRYDFDHILLLCLQKFGKLKLIAVRRMAAILVKIWNIPLCCWPCLSSK